MSLLSIGYGDVYPQTNAGKSFYVFWSLLAVPTLTILISNMGDTVIRLVKDATLWLGELTILPGDSNRERLKRLARAGKKTKQSSLPRKAASGFKPGNNLQREAEESEDQQQEPGGENLADADLEKREQSVERDELEEADAARAKGDPQSENKHDYRFLLIREARRVMKDVGTQPPKQYSYDQWSWFLRLLGESESDEKFHRDAELPDDVKANAEGRHDVGRQHSVVPWSWLGERSPLLGDTEEAEWVLERLTVRLEEELRAESNRQDNVSRGRSGQPAET